MKAGSSCHHQCSSDGLVVLVYERSSNMCILCMGGMGQIDKWCQVWIWHGKKVMIQGYGTKKVWGGYDTSAGSMPQVWYRGMVQLVQRGMDGLCMPVSTRHFFACFRAKDVCQPGPSPLSQLFVFCIFAYLVQMQRYKIQIQMQKHKIEAGGYYCWDIFLRAVCWPPMWSGLTSQKSPCRV